MTLSTTLISAASTSTGRRSGSRPARRGTSGANSPRTRRRSAGDRRTVLHARSRPVRPRPPLYLDASNERGCSYRCPDPGDFRCERGAVGMCRHRRRAVDIAAVCQSLDEDDVDVIGVALRRRRVELRRRQRLSSARFPLRPSQTVRSRRTATSAARPCHSRTVPAGTLRPDHCAGFCVAARVAS